jgi:hypothetical protein
VSFVTSDEPIRVTRFGRGHRNVRSRGITGLPVMAHGQPRTPADETAGFAHTAARLPNASFACWAAPPPFAHTTGGFDRPGVVLGRRPQLDAALKKRVTLSS